jgi:hypothetical protein
MLGLGGHIILMFGLQEIRPTLTISLGIIRAATWSPLPTAAASKKIHTIFLH